MNFEMLEYNNHSAVFSRVSEGGRDKKEGEKLIGKPRWGAVGFHKTGVIEAKLKII